MRETDSDAFFAMLHDVWSMVGKTPTPGQMAMFFRALSAYRLDDVRRAFDAHVKDPQRGRFAPVPADLIAQLEGAAADDGRPGPEEAWAIALGAADESATVVWTEEIAAAWTAAKPVFAIGDEVGARMAFRECYSRILLEVRKRREPAAWRVSLGFDKDLRRAALEAAVKAGRLPGSELLGLPAPSSDGLFPLLEAAARSPVADQVREDLRALADRMRHRVDDAIPVDTSERDALAAKKAVIADVVDRFIAGERPHGGD